jgi:hypothetical protein
MMFSPPTSASDATEDVFIKKWETPLIKEKLVTYEGHDGPFIKHLEEYSNDSTQVQPSWALIREGFRKPFSLVNFGNDGKIIKKVAFGKWNDGIASKDGQHFAMYKFDPSDYRFDISILAKNGDVVGSLKDAGKPVYLAPGVRMLVTTGGKLGHYQIYNRHFELIGSFGKPSYASEVYRYLIKSHELKDRVILLLDWGVLVLGWNGDLIFKTSARKSFFNEQSEIIITDNTNKEEKVISVFKVDGEAISLDNFFSHATWEEGESGSNHRIFCSPDGNYMGLASVSNFILMGLNGREMYRLDTRGANSTHFPIGYLSDTGEFVGFLSNQNQMVKVTKAGIITLLDFPKPTHPRAIKSFDFQNGTFLSLDKDFVVSEKGIVEEITGWRFVQWGIHASKLPAFQSHFLPATNQ